MITSLAIGSISLFLLCAFYFSFRSTPNKNLHLLSRTSDLADEGGVETNAEAMQHLAEEEVWWHQLELADQLDLAVELAKKALPAWEKYAAENELVYRNAGTGPFLKIDRQLLFDALRDVQQLYDSGAPNGNKLLHQYYDSFIGPLIAMQDGNWPATYQVKKVFLAVYNILKGILDQDNISALKNLLALSIGQSLDCLDISKLYSREEIESFLEVYKIKVVS